jgi:hypothetical protein
VQLEIYNRGQFVVAITVKAISKTVLWVGFNQDKVIGRCNGSQWRVDSEY